MNRKLTMIIAGLMLGGIFAATPVKAFFQADPRDQIIPSIELDQADVRDALRLLFKQVNVDYTVDSGVQGTVTVKLTNQPFETVLRNLLGQVNATWRVEGNVYNIVPKPVDNGLTQDPGIGAEVPKTDKAPPVRIKIRHADPQYIMMMINAQTTPRDEPEMSSYATGGLGGGSGMGGGMGGGSGMGGGGFGSGGGGSFGGGGGSFGGGGGSFGGGGGSFGGGGGSFGGGGGGAGRGGF